LVVKVGIFKLKAIDAAGLKLIPPEIVLLRKPRALPVAALLMNLVGRPKIDFRKSHDG
jgi:hypothetical protein